MRFTKPMVLSQSEMEKIHAGSLAILERAGVRVLDPECRVLLAKAGAKSDAQGEKVYLPSKLVEEYLAQAPSRFRLCRRDGTAIEVGTDTRVFGSLAIDPWVIDFETQRPRRPVLADVVRNTRLGDALDNVAFMYRMDMPPEDVCPEEAYIKTLEAFAINTTKPMLAAPASREMLYNWLELADILADGCSLAERPILSLCTPVTTPLTFHEFDAQVMKEGIRRGLPLCGQTEPIAGTTAPLSFAGGLLMGNCENVFLVVMAQLLKSGSPIAYSIGNALTDFRTGRAVFFPADKMLWKIASLQMAEFYKLPIEAEATGSLVGRYDTQNGVEHALHMLPAVICGGGMFNGLGSCYNACGMSTEMVMIHSDIVLLMERLRQGVDVSEKLMAVESIIDAGPGGTFLMDPLTVEMLRTEEFFTTGCFDRLGERSPNRFEDSLLARAHQRVEELLSTHTPAVPTKIVEEIRLWATKKCDASGKGS